MITDLMQRQQPWRSEKYLKWIRTLPCSNCSEIALSEPHHLIGIAGLGVMGDKAGDQFAVPLCRKCHEDLHALKVPLNDQWRWMKKTIERAFNQGIVGIINHP